jgi:MBG domain (YGX type)/Bacterial Ig-like domain (group 2)
LPHLLVAHALLRHPALLLGMASAFFSTKLGDMLRTSPVDVSDIQMTSPSWSMCVRCLCVLMLAMGMAWSAVNNDFDPTSGDWNVDANWTAKHKPLSSEDVTIAAGKTVTVSPGTGPISLAAKSLTVSGALHCTPGTPSNSIRLTLGTSLNITGEVTVAGPTLTIDQENPADGTSASPSVTVAIATGATLNLGGDTTLNLNLGIHLSNDGTLNLGSKAIIIYDENPYSDFTQGASGHLYWMINNNGLSAFRAPSSVTLGGTLHLLRPGGVTFSAGDSIPLIDEVKSNISGNFTTFSGTADFTNTYAAPSHSYAFEASGTPTVTTVTVTIANQTRYFGQANPANTFSVSGLLAGDTNDSLGTAIFAGSGVTADSTTVPGDYPITLTFSNANANYQINPITDAWLRILPLSSLLSQTITFPVLTDLPLRSSSRPLGALASSRLPIFYISSDTSVATVNNSTGVVTAVAAGMADITATQAGNATYTFAPSITRRLVVAPPISQTITFVFASGTTTSLVVGDTLRLTATSDSGLAVSYTSSDASVATISDGNLLTALAVGNASIIAHQEGNALYDQASPLPRTVTVTASATTSGATGSATTDTNCGVGGGVALLLGALLFGWRRRS